MKISKAEYDALPEALKALYTPDGDGYAPTFKTPDQIEAEFGGLKAQNEKLLAEKKTAKERETAAEKAAREAAEKAARASGDIEALDKSYNEKIAKIQKEFDDYRGSTRSTIEGLTVGSAVTDLSVKLSKGNAELLKPFLQQRIRLGDDNKIQILDKDGNLSALTAADLEKEFREDKRFAPIVDAPASQGTPAGDKGLNPVKVEKAQTGEINSLDIARAAVQAMPQQ